MEHLPFGTDELSPAVELVPGPPRRVRCYVCNCNQLLRIPTRNDLGQTCPIHGIRCHHSTSSSTFSYANARRNVIISPTLLADRILGNPFKFESHRLGLENSEDALTWNVFRSLQEAGCLKEVAHWITGQHHEAEPELFLWGVGLTNDNFRPWDLLVAARRRFETRLPVKRPLTEPDIALFLPSHYLILIEAKFTSPNPFYTDGPRKNLSSLTKKELLGIYRDRRLEILDGERAEKAERVHYQLWRNMVFAEWMSGAAGGGTKAYHANLTRAGHEYDSCSEFRQLIRAEFANRFSHFAWEDLYHLSVRTNSDLSQLRKYLETKTAGLKKAFAIGTG